MPFNRDNKPRLIERLRGKSGQDLFNEVKNALNSDSRRMQFESPPSFWAGRENAFPRGFPFDDEPTSFRSRRHRPFERFSDFGRSTSDIAEPPGYEENGAKRRVVDQEPEPEAASEPEPKTSPLSHHGLRNTVPFAQTPNNERSARAMSAPPGDRPARFTSTCEIPVVGDQHAAPQPQPTQQPHQPSNVRVIPIRVEGRDEPLINSNIDTSSNFASEPPSFEARLPRDFGNFRKQSPRFQQPSPPPPQAQKPPTAPKQPKPVPQQSKPSPQQPGVDETDKVSQPPPDPTTLALNRIAQVQQEVENLGKQVDAAVVATRKDKQYVYLDEMLTRQLLHLDNIDPAGNDAIRQARKDAIRSIQKCISVLESKVPTEPMDVVEETSDSTEPMTQEVSKDSEAPVSGELPPTSEPTPTTDPPA